MISSFCSQHLYWFCSFVLAESQKKKKKKKKNKKGLSLPPEIAAVPELVKYWAQRYRLFSRFDDGIKLDRGNVDV